MLQWPPILAKVQPHQRVQVTKRGSGIFIVLIFELFIPLVLFFILLGIRKKQPAYTVNSSEFPAYPLPSAGVIAVMQAFCDNGVRDEDGFMDFQNSSVTLFLEKLNNVSHNTNFFQPGFTPSEMDEIPDIYRSLLEDPVAVHDCFTNASQQPIGTLLRNRTEFEDFLVHNMSLPSQGLQALFNSSLNNTKLYDLIFGLDQPLVRRTRSIGSRLLSLGHLDALFERLNRHRQQIGLLYRAITWIFDSETTRPPPKLNMNETVAELMAMSNKEPQMSPCISITAVVMSTICSSLENGCRCHDLFLSPDSLHVLFCNGEGLPYVLNQDPATSQNDLVELQGRFCVLNKDQLDLLSQRLKYQLDIGLLVKMLNLEEWSIIVARNRVKKLISDLTRFMKFEMTLKELSYLAQALPQDACYSLNSTAEDNIYNDTSSEPPPPRKKAKTSQYGLLKIWLGMQKTICGKEHTQPLSSSDDGEINLEELGMSKYQMEKLGILVHVLYTNPKVLFAPNNTAADEIIKKANETFELLDTITQYSQKMLNISEEIRIFLAQNSTDHSLEVLKKIRENLRRYPHMLKMFHSSSLDMFSRGSLIVDKENFLAELAVIDNAACGWIHLMSGLSLNIFRGFDSQADLLKYFQNQAYHDNVTVLASVIFNLEKNGSLPKHLTYTIRQNASFTPTTNLARNRFWFPGPRNWGYNNYYHFGFVWIQDILERAMVNQYTKKDVVEPGSYIHQFPYPCYMQDQFLFMIEHVMPLCLAISWVYSVAMLVQNIVYEKEQRLKEVMKTMGLNSAVHWLAWFITSFLQMSTTAAILTVILKYGRVLTYSNPLLIFLMLEIFVIANISFSFLVSVVYSKAKLAAACAGIIYFLTYVPYMYIAVREEAAHDHIPAWVKNLACLLSTTAFGLGAKYFAFYEEIGVGVQWSNLGTSPVEDDQFTLRNVAVMMLVDSLIYSLLVWYIENAHPGGWVTYTLLVWYIENAHPGGWVTYTLLVWYIENAHPGGWVTYTLLVWYIENAHPGGWVTYTLLVWYIENAHPGGWVTYTLLVWYIENAHPGGWVTYTLLVWYIENAHPGGWVTYTLLVWYIENAHPGGWVTYTLLVWYIENAHPGGWVNYSLLVWYIENAHPGSYGLPKPWYFPFTRSYWLGSHVPHQQRPQCWQWCPGSHLAVLDDDQACLLSHNLDSKYFEADPQNQKLAVCIDNLMKHYKSGNKMAVNRLSLNLYEGQITSFLGHNGAGKTTTISLLTGLFPPTHGRAVIYGHDIRTEMDLIRQSMGMCPQHNVLFDELTVEEHLWFYSRLKNNPSKDIDMELEKMMADLNLPMKKVDYLSGGMKRKLSVAIAFVGGSRVVILDEPTAGVDPYSRRAIWDLILKYKKDRTILLSTHHMDEADILGDRIAIISNGRLQCCGSPLFLKNNLGEGYHLVLVKSDPGCPIEPISALLSRLVPGSTLVDDTPRELHYILPLSQSPNYGQLFAALDHSLGSLRVTSYGIKHCTLEEVFLKVATQDDHSKGEANGFVHPVDISDEPGPATSAAKPGHKKRFSDDGRANYYKLEPIGSQRDGEGPSGEAGASQRRDGAGKHRVEGKLLLVQQCGAILAKRYWYTKRNWKGLFSQILLPAFFVSVAMSVALTAPKLEELPPLVLSPSQYFNLTQPQGNVIPFANNGRDSSWMTDANSSSLVNTLIHMPSGVGATCVLKHAFNNTFEEDLNFNVREFSLLAKYFEPSCESVFLPGLPPKNFVPLPPTASPQFSPTSTDPSVTPVKERFYPYCHCSEDGTGFVCQNYGFTPDPPTYKVVTGDILLDISGQREQEYYLYTTDAYRLRRYGAFSFSHERDYVPPKFGQDAPPIFRKIAVRNVAKVWYNNKGYHSLPTYINSLNNAILRANLPKEMGNPAAYGITVINHPMTDTSYMPSKDQIIQGTDVLIAIFIIVAMSFVPASFVLFLVYERYVKAKHLHEVSGVHPVVYWVSNYLWDMCSYVVPATCCVLILLVFDIPAYSSRKNFPAVVALFLMYGWSITPVMYPVSFIFREPSTAYIFLIVINLFVGITCVVTSFLLEVFSYDAVGITLTYMPSVFVDSGEALNLRQYQTTLTRFRTGHLKPLKIENNNKIYPPCPKCCLATAAPANTSAFVIKTGSTTQWQADLAPKEMAASDMKNRHHVQPLLTRITNAAHPVSLDKEPLQGQARVAELTRGSLMLQYLGQVHKVLKTLFLFFPNYCLGRGLMDIAFNEYQNFFLFKTGQYGKMKSPFAWGLVTRNLVAMAFSGLGFFLLTLLLEYNFFRKAKVNELNLGLKLISQELGTIGTSWELDLPELGAGHCSKQYASSPSHHPVRNSAPSEQVGSWTCQTSSTLQALLITQLGTQHHRNKLGAGPARVRSWTPQQAVRFKPFSSPSQELGTIGTSWELDLPELGAGHRSKQYASSPSHHPVRNSAPSEQVGSWTCQTSSTLQALLITQLGTQHHRNKLGAGPARQAVRFKPFSSPSQELGTIGTSWELDLPESGPRHHRNKLELATIFLSTQISPMFNMNILVMAKDQRGEDQDVANERKRVVSGKANTDLIRLVNLTKIYQTRKLGQNLAVDRLCLGIPKGECLGLLGVNGAGKSTTFKMLTGDTSITAGDAFLNSYSIQSELNLAQQHIGYCPQFDALYDELTAREHLMLYSRFRGIPSCDERAVVDWALTKLDLVPYADKLARTFSGGNKRKLATAIALLGAPPIILLDEPTTGMDPHTRRFLWDLILEIVRGGRSVVLTSHSMEECEALCTRLGIMVNGRLRCLGSTQHLKNKFGEGYSIILRSSSQHDVPDWVRSRFPDAVLKEKHFNLYQYELRSHNISLSYVFSTLEQGLKDLPIEEYSVCQNTLDNVFINFVKQQTDTPQGQQQPLTPAEEHCLDDTGDDFAANLQRSHSRLAFLNLDLDV
ncbi:ABCA2 [Cordylochernes scorpioides]|uniref:ABCA2 n=1 Tax=Cordylochernes scorpioides TaxID=51811 RepID=A0ABY6K6Y5_9ARAC|nr:ABCA2 [Cordylochernes scorpioides]